MFYQADLPYMGYGNPYMWYGNPYMGYGNPYMWNGNPYMGYGRTEDKPCSALHPHVLHSCCYTKEGHLMAVVSSVQCEVCIVKC